MNYIRKYITAGNLAKVIDIPVDFKASMFEVIVRPVKKARTTEEINSLLEKNGQETFQESEASVMSVGELLKNDVW